MKKTIFTLLFLHLFSSEAFAQLNESTSRYEQFLSAINQKILVPWHKRISSKEFGARFDNIPDANNEIQKLGKEAQDTLKIPAERQVPIKKLLRYQSPIIGVARPEAIYINEREVAGKPYGYKKIIMLHESSHIKHYHAPKDFMLIFSAFSILGGYHAAEGLNCYLNKSLKKNYISRSWAFCGLLLASTLFAQKRQHISHERQADLDAAWYSNCSDCLNEYIVHISDDASNQGYLNSQECLRIAKTLQENNHKCKVHTSR